MSVRIVLANDIDLLDARIPGQEGSQGLHLHVDVGVEAEMPEAAFTVGQIGVDRGVIQEHDFLAGVALIVLVDGIDQRQRDTGTVALHDIAIALIDDHFQLAQRFLRAALVIETDKFEAVVTGQFLLLRSCRNHLKAIHLISSDRRKRTGQGVDIGDFDDCRGSDWRREDGCD